MKKIFFILVFISAALIGCSNQAEDENAEEVPVAVQVDEVTKETLTVEKSIYGKTTPKSSVPVIAPVAGEVTEVHVEKGQTVEEGDTIISITSPNTGEIEVDATIAGQITSLNASEGGVVSNTEPFATISELSSLHIQVGVTPETRQLFNDLEEVPVIVNEKEATATVDYVSSVPNQQTSLYEVEATLQDPAEDVLPGMTAIMRVTEEEVSEGLVIPTEALVEEGGSTYVYIIKEDKAIQTEVNVLRSLTDKTAVEGDIQEGDQVVVKGQLVLSDGKEVTIQEEDAS
ncbi:efflux RND transporter periplasmic adaptor subunit [Radiobacillus deserti]|uniref:Efflux RND transporter periplasmic adaptor subunit n=1 Tax=Radiobacillus deserti TaxID=2594883 RepID=A0A516KJN1_9BACI|nr:efflux RND transporter periplasmic adaptor subunit [Radiobacillus deserti]QDP41620.1 efflux RND transporter periplasmic adaptor subunit [Radiobacillus deserti]